MFANNWILFALAATLLYGVWGFFGAKAAPLIDSTSAAFYSSLGVLIGGGLCLLTSNVKLVNAVSRGSAYSMLNGLATGLACIFFIAALKRGPSLPIIMITALYPMITGLLCILFLKQDLTLKYAIGTILTMSALYCFCSN